MGIQWHVQFTVFLASQVFHRAQEAARRQHLCLGSKETAGCHPVAMLEAEALLSGARRCLRVRLLDLRPALRAVTETAKSPRVRMARSDPLRSGKDEPAAATGQCGTGAAVKPSLLVTRQGAAGRGPRWRAGQTAVRPGAARIILVGNGIANSTVDLAVFK